MSAVPPPPPPAPGDTGLPAAATQRHLDRTIGDVCARLPGVRPLESYSPARPPQWPGGRAALHDHPGGIDHLCARRLLTALAAAPLGGHAVPPLLAGMTIRAFRARTPQQQLAFIDQLWNALTTAHPFHTAIGQMLEPGGGDGGGDGPLPSSWCPKPGGGFHKRVLGHPFRDLGVGFRVDGADQGSIQRVLQQGMTQQRLNLAFMEQRRGQDLTGTVAADQHRARVWTGNHDIFNETAVCVSRNFFGATAFPERTTVHDANQFAVLWAVDCSGLNGFDTEGHQNALPNSRQWRPGEKAFQAIPAGRMLGWVPVRRHGAPAGGGWSFAIHHTAQWTFTGQPTPRQRAYLVGELAAWRGNHTIPAAWDFAT